MKKVLCLLLVSVLALGMLAGCGNGSATTDTGTDTADTATTEATPPPNETMPPAEEPAADEPAADEPAADEPAAEEPAEAAGEPGGLEGSTITADGVQGPGGGLPADLKVGFCELSVSDPWRQAQVASMQKAADDRGIEYVMTEGQDKMDKQLSDFEDLLNQGCNFIFLAPLNTDGFQAVLDKAREANVPVICIDREVTGTPGQDFVCAIISNFITQGEECGQWLLDNVKKDSIRVVQITGKPGGSDVRDRTQGFQNKVDESAGKMEVVSSQNGEWSKTTTQRVLQNVIQSLGEDGFDAVYCQNDEMAMGAVLALQAAGIAVGAEGVPVVTVDGQKQAVQHVIDGTISAISTCTPLFGEAAFTAMEEWYDGKVMPNIIYNKEKLITAETAEEELLVAWGN